MVFPLQFSSSFPYSHTHFTTRSPAPGLGQTRRQCPFSSYREFSAFNTANEAIRLTGSLNEGEFTPIQSPQKVELKWKGGDLGFHMLTEGWRPICRHWWLQSTHCRKRLPKSSKLRKKLTSCGSGQDFFIRQGFVIICAQGLGLLQFSCPFLFRNHLVHLFSVKRKIQNKQKTYLSATG